MPAKHDAFVAYLVSCGGKDRSEFFDDNGNPDTSAARVYAEGMRSKWKDIVGTMITVEQVLSRVTVTLIASPVNV